MLTTHDIELLQSTRQRVALKFVYYEALSAGVADGVPVYSGDLYHECRRRLYPIYEHLAQPTDSYYYDGPSSIAKFFRDHGWITIEDRYHNYVDGGQQLALEYNEVIDGIVMHDFLEILDKVDERIVKPIKPKIDPAPPAEEVTGDHYERQDPPDLLRRVIYKIDDWINKAAAFLTGV